MEKQITTEELKTRLDSGEDIRLIDVREAHEHEEFNIGGNNLPVGNIQSWAEDVVGAGDPEVIMYCRSGARSGMATMFLTAKGHPNVKNLVGGMIAWKEALESA